MYSLEETENEAIVRGPQGYEMALSNEAVGIVLRPDIDCPFGEPRPYTIRVAEMTHCEIVGCALEIMAYPQQLRRPGYQTWCGGGDKSLAPGSVQEP